MKRVSAILLCYLAVFLGRAASPYVSRVFEYRPAPGQFVNMLPPYEPGDDAAAMVQKVQDRIGGKANGSAVSLGGFGGYLIVGFDHAIVNEPDACDFKVYGNSYDGNAEPGVIWVMADENGNGLPDDTWYEIHGSAHDSSATRFGYAVTYFRPSAENDAATTTVEQYIHWTDNLGGEGWLPKNAYHQQSYYPQWISGDSYTQTGTRLPDNAHYDENSGVWTLSSFEFGYADNVGNNNARSEIDIDWAVDSEGNPAQLAAIDFIKIQNGEHQLCGWIGETSTEVSGIEELHPADAVKETRSPMRWVGNPVKETLEIELAEDADIRLCRLDGRCALATRLTAGRHRIPCTELTAGNYLLRINNSYIIIVKL